jgi:hypothetical protein
VSYEIIEAQIEEFQQATWVADLVSAMSFGGSGTFTLNDGSTWTGATVSERFDVYRYHTRVVGGAGKLGAIVQDKFYSGNVSLQVAVGDICNEGGESIGQVAPGIILTTYQRQQGTVAAALNQLAAEFGMIWWIDRNGLVNMNTARPTSGDANGTRISSDVDASIVLVDPVSVVLGASYDSSDSTAAMKAIQHVRWRQTDKQFSAEIYPVPFLYRPPTLTVYERMYNARVDKDNGDGTIDVIVDQRFGVTAVPFFCGVPHSKTKLDGGDQVTFGFFGGNPNAPFATTTAQDTTATKQVARNGDSTQSGESDDSTFWNWMQAFMTIVQGAPIPEPGNGSPSAFQTALQAAFAASPFPSSLTGKITSGSDRLKVGD